MDLHRHARRVREELDLQAAYDSEAVHVTCTNERFSRPLGRGVGPKLGLVISILCWLISL